MTPIVLVDQFEKWNKPITEATELGSVPGLPMTCDRHVQDAAHFAANALRDAGGIAKP